MPIPAGPVGPAWASGSWPDTAWAQGAWGAGVVTPRPSRPGVGGVFGRETSRFPIVHHQARGASMATIVITPFTDWRRIGAGGAVAQAVLEQLRAHGAKRTSGARTARCALTLSGAGAANDIEALLALYYAALTSRR